MSRKTIIKKKMMMNELLTVQKGSTQVMALTSL